MRRQPKDRNFAAGGELAGGADSRIHVYYSRKLKRCKYSSTDLRNYTDACSAFYDIAGQAPASDSDTAE